MRAPRSNLHRSFKGRMIDMAKLREVNGDMRALGNANLNARGDRIDSKGRIIKRRDQIIQEYYANNPNGVKYVSLSNPNPKNNIQFETMDEVREKIEKKSAPVTPKSEDFKTLDEIDIPDNVVSKRGSRKLVNDEEKGKDDK